MDILTGTALPAHLLDQAAVPLHDGVQRQGDVIVLPLPVLPDVPRTSLTPEPIPAVGLPVVRGEATTHTHLLVGDGTWTPGHHVQDRGIVEVPTAAYLLHPEHAALGLAPGRYLLRRQRQIAFTGPETSQPQVVGLTVLVTD